MTRDEVEKLRRDLKRKKKRPKYRNKKTTEDNHTFDSLKEHRRYRELKLLERTGIIRDLDLQPSFKISPGGVVDPATGKKMAARKFTADFQYFDTSLKATVIEEIKSPATAKEVAYRLRRQLFIEQYGKKYIFKEIV